MAVVPGFLRLPPDSTGKMIDATIVTVAGNSVYREVGVIGDPQTPGNYAQVDSSGRLFALSFLTTDGSTILGTGANPLRTDPTGTTIQPVSGTVTANQGGAPWSVAFSAPQHLIVDSGSISVSNFPATQAVTQSTSPWTVAGSVTANIGTTGGLALDATISNQQFVSATTTPPAKVGLVGGVEYDPLNPSPKYLPLPLGRYGEAVLVHVGEIQRDAFARVRVSEVVNLFDSVQQYDDNPLFWQTVITGSGTSTHVANASSCQLGVTGVNGDSVIRQSKKYIRYQPGKSQQIMMTGIMGALKTNVIQRVGYFDNENGLFFQQDGVNLSVVIRSKVSGSVVDTVVNQSSWNLDKLNGSGPSGVVVDMSKSQLFLIDFQWLGSGRIRWGMFFNGRPVYCHVLPATNSLSSGPYMTTGNLPVRYEIKNTGTTSGATTLLATCCSVSSEGGQQFPPGYTFAASNGATSIAVTTRRPILSIRPKVTFGGITNRALIDLQGVDIVANGGTLYWELVYNGSLTGASFGSVDANSIADFDVAATAISGGTVIGSGFAAGGSGTTRVLSSADISGKLPITLDFAGAVPDIITLVCTSFSGSTNGNGAFNWSEVR